MRCRTAAAGGVVDVRRLKPSFEEVGARPRGVRGRHVRQADEPARHPAQTGPGHQTEFATQAPPGGVGAPMTTAAPLRPQRLATRGGSSPRTAFVLSAPRASERCKLGCATHNLLKLHSNWIANTAEIHQTLNDSAESPSRPDSRSFRILRQRSGRACAATPEECESSPAAGLTPARLGAVVRARATAWRRSLWNR